MMGWCDDGTDDKTIRRSEGGCQIVKFELINFSKFSQISLMATKAHLALDHWQLGAEVLVWRGAVLGEVLKVGLVALRHVPGTEGVARE